ncbi:hypothetical protein A5651_06765 [Mycobacterium sp. 1274761.0]|nr:hypothetical protein A5651_06765 [Mycobacterium sp. 1274761.0]
MRPDISDDQIGPGELTDHDIALNSLCQFDIAYCFVVAAMGTHHASAYPSSAAFDEDRAKPIAQRVVTDADLRRRMFPGVPDAQIATAIQQMYELAIRESATNYGSRWWAMPPSVDQWVTHNLPPR